MGSFGVAQDIFTQESKPDMVSMADDEELQKYPFVFEMADKNRMIYG